MDESIVLDISTWTLLTSLILPLLVGVVTKKVASAQLKSILLAVLAAANGVATSAIQNEGILSSETLSAAVVSFVIAVASYYGFLKPTGVAPAVQEKTADLGVG